MNFSYRHHRQTASFNSWTFCLRGPACWNTVRFYWDIQILHAVTVSLCSWFHCLDNKTLLWNLHASRAVTNRCWLARRLSMYMCACHTKLKNYRSEYAVTWYKYVSWWTSEVIRVRWHLISTFDSDSCFPIYSITYNLKLAISTMLPSLLPPTTLRV